MTRTLGNVLSFIGFKTRTQRRTITVNVGGQFRSVTANDGSDWVETWLPADASGVDVWLAHRRVQGGYQVEWELTTRARLEVGPSFSIAVPGQSTVTVPVTTAWPAGRRLSGRVGPELDLWDHWSKPGGFKDRFGPLNARLPNVPASWMQQSTWTGQLATLRAVRAAQTGSITFEDSTDGIIEAWRGPWACWERADPGPGSPGGSGIFHADGWQNCVEYARLACEIESVSMGRMWAFYNADGSVFGVDQFLPGISPACASEASAKPAQFPGADEVWTPISLSHYTRVMRRVGLAYEMTGSRLARRHLISLAECARLQFTESGVLATLELGSGYLAWNLTSWENRSIAVGNNGRLSSIYAGTVWDRNQGWALWCASWAKKSGMPWTPGWQNWTERLLACFSRNQMPNGLLGRTNRGDVDAGNTDIAASMHEALMGLGVLAAQTQVGIDMTAFLNAQAATLYRTNSIKGPYSGQVGPVHFPAVGPLGHPDSFDI